MPLSTEDQAKLDTLMQMIADGLSPRVCEVDGFFWPDPTSTVYYAADQYDELFPELGLSPLETRLSFNNNSPFREVVHEAGISDQTVDFDLWDADGAISDLFNQHGAGVRVEIFYYFPDVDLLLSEWWGHLQPPDTIDCERFVAQAAVGFRSSMLPLPRRAYFSGCQAIYPVGVLFTQAEIDENDCPVNAHIGGAIGLNDPLTGQLYPTCPRNSRAVCIQRIGDDKSFLAFDTAVETQINNQTRGPALMATSRGNESNLKRPLRVIFGHRVARQLDLLAFIPALDTNHPDKGFVWTIFAICEGRIRSITNCKVNGTLINNPALLSTRLGEKRQGKTNFSPNVSNYSGTALFFGIYGQVNAAQYNASNLSGEAEVDGLADVRVYTTETDYTEQFTTNRAWALLRILSDKRWGLGYDVRRFEIAEDFIPLASWCDQIVSFTGADGTVYRGPRSTFNAELIDRNAQQQITDLCLAGRFGLPFPYQGKLRVMPLSRVEIDDTIPVFLDQDGENICRDEQGKSTLTRSIIPDSDLPNKIVLPFEDAAHGNVERPLTFEDVTQQLRAGRAFGDTSRRVVEKKCSALGVTGEGEAGRLGNLLLDLGEFDEGGLRNNLRIEFDTWFAFCLELHKYKVIRVVSPQLTRYGFEYFRIRSITRKSTLICTVSAQAYPVDYYDAVETPATDDGGDGGGGGGDDGGGDDGDPIGGRPRPVTIADLRHSADRIQFSLALDE